ncbi:hypothetical protein [Aquirufa salirivi]|uniref:Uncharacterized protein n=1 Tax=Aquirufa salirivi TaxID=3104729 RepID=A0ABW8RYK6_9BACT
MKDSQNDNLGSSNVTQEKKNWISPKIAFWENENIENSGGLGADGGSKAYVS